MMKNIIDIRPEFYDKKTKLFCFEISSVHCIPTMTIYLRNPKTGNEIMFIRDRIDMDATGEDTYGWHYRSADAKGEYSLLIIND